MPRKILLADDSVTAQNMGRRILTEAGYEVVTVNNGSAALKKLPELNPDLVILDIYMPGYGGIEVCQKIKEAAETSNIPVLLTVGKLEPFKADEARRVRADAHLVKPFEATELLAALAKLEEKIAPRNGGRAPAKAAKGKSANPAPAAVKDKKSGDADGGWKSRLTIPPPQAKRAAVEEVAPKTAFREFARNETPAAEAETSSSQEGLSQDITAEEIAAITAAAAAFGNRAEAEHSEPAVTEEEIVAAVSYMPLPAPEAEPELPAEAAIDLSSLPDTAFFTDADLPEEEKIAQAEASVEAETAAVEAPVAPAVATDEEVAAMLAALAPVYGGDGAGQNGDGLGAAVSKAEPEFAEASPSWRSFAVAGARWMAEPVAVPANEASLILEEEMQKAYAAREAESVAARAEFTGSETHGAGADEIISPPAEDFNVAAVSMQSFEPASATGDPVAAEMSAASIQEPEQEREAESIRAEEPSRDTIGAIAEINEERATVDAEATQSVEAAAEENVNAAPAASAYAAAVGTEFHSISHVEAASTPDIPAEVTQSAPSSAPAVVDSEHEAELAAAWAHWRQIRETVANPQFTSQIADAAAAGYKEIHPPEAASDGPSEEEVSATAADPAAIASIVDSVLAELKPKLVAEIARKLGKEKK